MIERKLQQATDAASTHLFLENPALAPRDAPAYGAALDAHRSEPATTTGTDVPPEDRTQAVYAAAAAFTSIGSDLGLGLTAQYAAFQGNGMIARSLAPRLTFMLTSQVVLGLRLRHVLFSTKGAPVIDSDRSDYANGYATGFAVGVASRGKGGSWELLYRPFARGKANAGEERIVSLPALYAAGVALNIGSGLDAGASIRVLRLDDVAEAQLVAVEDEQGLAAGAQLLAGFDVKGRGNGVWRLGFAREWPIQTDREAWTRDGLLLSYLTRYGREQFGFNIGLRILAPETGARRLTETDAGGFWNGP